MGSVTPTNLDDELKSHKYVTWTAYNNPFLRCTPQIYRYMHPTYLSLPSTFRFMAAIYVVVEKKRVISGVSFASGNDVAWDSLLLQVSGRGGGRWKGRNGCFSLEISLCYCSGSGSSFSVTDCRKTFSFVDPLQIGFLRAKKGRMTLNCHFIFYLTAILPYRKLIQIGKAYINSKVHELIWIISIFVVNCQFSTETNEIFSNGSFRIS